jgi:tRNA threonylcarbamoyladenosine modification (KEOPS) complex  Pcc1 subunit
MFMGLDRYVVVLCDLQLIILMSSLLFVVAMGNITVLNSICEIECFIQHIFQSIQQEMVATITTFVVIKLNTIFRGVVIFVAAVDVADFRSHLMAGNFCIVLMLHQHPSKQGCRRHCRSLVLVIVVVVRFTVYCCIV